MQLRSSSPPTSQVCVQSKRESGAKAIELKEKLARILFNGFSVVRTKGELSIRTAYSGHWLNARARETMFKGPVVVDCRQSNFLINTVQGDESFVACVPRHSTPLLDTRS